MLLNKLRKTFAVTLRVNHKIIDVLDTQDQSLIIIFIDYKATLIQFFLLTILISTVSQLGDIVISYFKRLSKIKNTGKLIPGHGGLLDRIDGMIFAFPIYYLINLTGHLNI